MTVVWLRKTCTLSSGDDATHTCDDPASSTYIPCVRRVESPEARRNLCLPTVASRDFTFTVRNASMRIAFVPSFDFQVERKCVAPRDLGPRSTVLAHPPTLTTVRLHFD